MNIQLAGVTELYRWQYGELPLDNRPVDLPLALESCPKDVNPMAAGAVFDVIHRYVKQSKPWKPAIANRLAGVRTIRELSVFCRKYKVKIGE